MPQGSLCRTWPPRVWPWTALGSWVSALRSMSSSAMSTRADGQSGSERRTNPSSRDAPGPREMLPLWELICDDCRRRFAPSAMLWRCTCGGVLDLAFTHADQIVADGTSATGLWRYRAALPRISDENMVTFGEGMTPLVDARHRSGVMYKLDYLFPTGSFKDRGSTVLTSCLNELGVERVVEDSSGNAGASMAAYFAAGGIDA